MKKVVSIVTLVTAIFFSMSVMAHTKVVVIPLGGKKPAGVGNRGQTTICYPGCSTISIIKYAVHRIVKKGGIRSCFL